MNVERGRGGGNAQEISGSIEQYGKSIKPMNLIIWTGK